MARSKQEIDYLNQIRKDGGLELLPYEDETPEGGDEGDTDAAAKAELERKAKEEADLKLTEEEKAKKEAEEKNNPVAEKKDGVSPTATTVELTDEEMEAKMLEYLEKKGKKVSSLDEILNPAKEPTEEEKKALAEKEEAKKVAYWLSNGLVTKKEYDSYNRDIANPEKVAFAQFAKEAKEATPDITDEEIKEDFENEYSINAEADSIAAKRGKRRLELVANNIIESKYKKINEAENAYSEYISEAQEDATYKATITAKTPTYKRDVEDIVASLTKLKIPIGDKQEAEVDFSPEVINEVKELYLKGETAEKKISDGYTKELLGKEAQMIAVMKDLPNLFKKYGDAQVLKFQAGLRGVVPEKPSGERASKTKAAETINGFDPYAYTGAKRPVEN